MRSIDTRTNFSDFVHLKTQVLMLKMINMTCIDTSNNFRTFFDFKDTILAAKHDKHDVAWYQH